MREKFFKSEKPPQQIKSIIKIQSAVRGYLTRKKYTIKQLSPSDQVSYPTFVVGTDPIITGLEKYKSTHKIALIGTSGLRAVEISCAIGSVEKIPKIFLIDNSKEVCLFWHHLKDFFSSCLSEQIFMENIAELLEICLPLYRDLAQHGSFENEPLRGENAIYPDQNIHRYLLQLFTKYSFDFVRSVVLNASIIRQSWADTSTFIKVNNILKMLEIDKVYVYPSNIIDCCPGLESLIADNILLLDPTLIINVNHIKGRLPHQVKLLGKEELKSVIPSDENSSSDEECSSDTDMLDSDINENMEIDSDTEAEQWYAASILTSLRNY